MHNKKLTTSPSISIQFEIPDHHIPPYGTRTVLALSKRFRFVSRDTENPIRACVRVLTHAPAHSCGVWCGRMTFFRKQTSRLETRLALTYLSVMDTRNNLHTCMTRRADSKTGPATRFCPLSPLSLPACPLSCPHPPPSVLIFFTLISPSFPDERDPGFKRVGGGEEGGRVRGGCST